MKKLLLMQKLITPPETQPKKFMRELLTNGLGEDLTQEGKAVQIVGYPHKEQFSSPKRLLIPLSLSAKEALRAVKAFFGIGGNTENIQKITPEERQESQEWWDNLEEEKVDPNTETAFVTFYKKLPK